MAEATYLHDGDIHKFTAAQAYAAGEVIQAAGRAAVVQGLRDLVTGEEVVARAEGVFTVAAKSADTFSDGDAVNWNDTTNEAQVAAGDWVLGKARGAKGAGETTMKVGLNE